MQPSFPDTTTLRYLRRGPVRDDVGKLGRWRHERRSLAGTNGPHCRRRRRRRRRRLLLAAPSPAAAAAEHRETVHHRPYGRTAGRGRQRWPPHRRPTAGRRRQRRRLGRRFSTDRSAGRAGSAGSAAAAEPVTGSGTLTGRRVADAAPQLLGGRGACRSGGRQRQRRGAEADVDWRRHAHKAPVLKGRTDAPTHTESETDGGTQNTHTRTSRGPIDDVSREVHRSDTVVYFRQVGGCFLLRNSSSSSNNCEWGVLVREVCDLVYGRVSVRV